MIKIKIPEFSIKSKFSMKAILLILCAISTILTIASWIVGFTYFPAALTVICTVITIFLCVYCDTEYNSDCSPLIVALFLGGLVMVLFQMMTRFDYVFGHEDVYIKYDQNGKIEKIDYFYNDEYAGLTDLKCEKKYFWFDRFTGEARVNGCDVEGAYSVSIDETCVIGKDQASAVPFKSLNNYAIYDYVELRNYSIYCKDELKYPIDYKTLIKWN
jgi:hypothetical protein